MVACILSFTETGLQPNISAAGHTVQSRQYTALADAEFLINGARSRDLLRPGYGRMALAAGISPAVITRAVVSEQNILLQLLSTGLPDRLTVPHVRLPQVIAKAVQTGQAMTMAQVKSLVHSGLRYGQYWGQRWGRKLGSQASYLVLGECVVGGTTTAQAVLSALGYDVAGRMSSSQRVNNHLQKQALVEAGLAIWRSRNCQPSALQQQLFPLAAVAAVGDPMQAVAAGVAIAASRYGGILLAGGSQMLAVYALAKALAHSKLFGRWRTDWCSEQVVVGTTRWVIEDKGADTVAIAHAVGAPYIASDINFSSSPYFQLRAYERGFVKEGVGAGGCAIAAYLYQNWTVDQLRHAVEAQLRLYL